MSRLSAISERAERTPTAPPPTPAPPKYPRITVDTDEPDDDAPTKVNIRVLMALLRAGVALSSIIPPAARTQLNAQLAKSGVAFDLNQLKPQNLENLIE